MSKKTKSAATFADKKKNNKTVKLRKISAFFYNKHLSIEGLYSLS